MSAFSPATQYVVAEKRLGRIVKVSGKDAVKLGNTTRDTNMQDQLDRLDHNIARLQAITARNNAEVARVGAFLDRIAEMERRQQEARDKREAIEYSDNVVVLR